MTAKKATTRGKPMNLYMRAEDVSKIRELTAYAAENGQRTSDSKIVRAALRAVKADRAFLAALKEAESADLRYKHE
jgi:Arc/MetJ-type ribon-helix-helix transcriptional regulator